MVEIHNSCFVFNIFVEINRHEIYMHPLYPNSGDSPVYGSTKPHTKSLPRTSGALPVNKKAEKA